MKSMKRTIAMLLTLALVFASFPLGAFAEQELVAEQSSEVGGVSPAEPQTEVKQEAEEETPLEIRSEEEKKPLQAPEDEKYPLFFKPSYKSAPDGYSYSGGFSVSDLKNGNKFVKLFTEVTIKVTNLETGEEFTSTNKLSDSEGHDVTDEYIENHGGALAVRCGGFYKNGTLLKVEITPNPGYHLQRIALNQDGVDRPRDHAGHEFTMRFDKDEDSTPALGYGKAWTLTFGRLDVTFDPFGGAFPNGSKEIVKETVKGDNTVDYPEDPTRPGYLFKGWFTRQAENPNINQKYGVRVWPKTTIFDDRIEGEAFNDVNYDSGSDGIFRLRALWRRPRVTFYTKSYKELENTLKEWKKGYILNGEPYKLYAGKSINDTQWADSWTKEDKVLPDNQKVGNIEHVYSQANAVFIETSGLPVLDTKYLPEGYEFDHWVYYEDGVEKEFTRDVVINDDMEVYPVFKGPQLTFFKKAKEEATEGDIQKQYFVADHMSLEKSLEVNADNTLVDKIENLPAFEGEVPAGMVFDRWVWYNSEGTEYNFTMKTKIDGKTDVYPVFRKPKLTFYVIEKPEEGGNPKYLIQEDKDVAKGKSLKDESIKLPDLDPRLNTKCKEFSHWVYYDENGKPQKFTEDMEITGDMQLYAAFKGDPVPPTPPTPPTPNPNEPSGPSGPSDPSNPSKPSTPDKPSTDQPSPNIPSKPGTDSGMKTPKGSPLTSSEIAKILASMKKTVPYIPRAGVGK